MSDDTLFAPPRAAAPRPQPAQAGRPAWQPWEMNSLPRITRPAPASAAAPAAPVPARPRPDRAELERLRREAREAGLAEGRQQGLAQGRSEGHAAGLAEGRAAGQAQAAAQAAQLRALAEGFAQALRGAEREVAAALTALALDVARQVVQRTVAADPECIVPLVQGLLRQEPALQGEPRLLLHPADLAAVEGALGAELQAGGWQLRPDEAIARGGCLVQAASGSLDATVPTRWERVAAALQSVEF